MALILLLHVKEGLESVEEWILWECYYGKQKMELMCSLIWWLLLKA